MGSVRLEESGEWSGGVPECRTAHAAHQQRVERGGAPPGLLVRFKAAKRIFVAEEFGPTGGGRRPGVKVGRPRRGVRSGEAPGVGGRRVRVECLLAPSRGGVLLLGETWSAD